MKAWLALAPFMQALLTSEEAQDLVEYALLASLIALAAITGISSLGTAIAQAFSGISTSLA